MTKKNIIVITGPTASGKSALAVSVAKTLNTEIISADSRQIYKDIPIVTAVPSMEEREGIKHHLIDYLPLDAYYSAAKFRDDAKLLLENIFIENDFAVVCGGSMLYLDALINGIDDIPTISHEFRENLMKEWSHKGNEWLIKTLKDLDPCYYEKVDLNNLKRVFHAVEVSSFAGKPYSDHLSKSKNKTNLNLTYNVIKFCLSGSRLHLFDRINSRVLKMVEMGLEQEAKKVYPIRYLNSLNTVGLKEFFAMFEGIYTKNEAISRIQKNTRVYAKKQLTWHKKDNLLNYIDFSDTLYINTEKILKTL